MKLTIDKNRVRNHFTYNWWQYLILIVCAIFGWNLLFTTTGYRTPPELKVDWYYQGPINDSMEKSAVALIRGICDEIHPEIEEINFVQVGTDETYGPMQLTVWVAAGEGDLYLLDYNSFSQVGSGMVDLQPYIDNGLLKVDGLKLKKGYVRDTETNEKYLCGIPAENFTGLADIGITLTDKVFGVLANCGNVDTTVEVMQKMLEIYGEPTEK